MDAERALQALQPPRVAQLGVVVQEAEQLPGGELRALVERADEPHVLVIAKVAERERAREPVAGSPRVSSSEALSTTQSSNGPWVACRLSTHARVSAGWLCTTSTTLVVTAATAAPWPGPAAAYRSESGTYFRSSAPE